MNADDIVWVRGSDWWFSATIGKDEIGFIIRLDDAERRHPWRWVVPSLFKLGVCPTQEEAESALLDAVRVGK